ncbi:hypothetical protein [Parachlamydia sp. AcF125]|uniref:hypothetical protein n=1 Tax=Parachlamydia sp. AcF125 TaxID=2795736 RepID=UPI001BC9AD6F|nr:hypothetical protein [Parachlamydia sp. AcF125]MBS4168642.1 hypothetical protein [Parachlamydia sp. AcF125]
MLALTTENEFIQIPFANLKMPSYRAYGLRRAVNAWPRPINAIVTTFILDQPWTVGTEALVSICINMAKIGYEQLNTSEDSSPSHRIRLKDRKIEFLDLTPEILDSIFHLLALADRRALACCCKAMNATFKEGLLHNLTEAEISSAAFDHVRKKFHASALIGQRIAQNKRILLLNKCLSTLGPIIKTFLKHLGFSGGSVASFLIRKYLPAITQGDVNAYNAKLPIRMPYNCCGIQGTYTITKPTTLEKWEKVRTLSSAIAALIQLGWILKDCYSGIRFLAKRGWQVKDKEVLELLHYPKALAKDRILKQFTIRQTGRVPLFPCVSSAGLRIDYFDQAREDWKTFSEKKTELQFDISAFITIQKRIAQLIEEGSLTPENILHFNASWMERP